MTGVTMKRLLFSSALLMTGLLCGMNYQDALQEALQKQEEERKEKREKQLFTTLLSKYKEGPQAFDAYTNTLERTDALMLHNEAFKRMQLKARNAEQDRRNADNLFEASLAFGGTAAFVQAGFLTLVGGPLIPLACGGGMFVYAGLTFLGAREKRAEHRDLKGLEEVLREKLGLPAIPE